MLTALIGIVAFGVGLYLGTVLEEHRPSWNDEMERHVQNAVAAAVREVKEELQD